MEKKDKFFPKTGYDVSFCDRLVSWQKFVLTWSKIVLGSLSDNDEEGDKNSKHFYVYAAEKKSRSRAVFLLKTFAAVLVYVLGRLSKYDVDWSENVIWKCNFAFLQSFCNYSKSLCLKNVF